MNKTKDLFCWSVAVLGWGCWRVHQHGEWECGEGRQDGNGSNVKGVVDVMMCNRVGCM